jgi:WASH complex subunit strumpellin
MDNTKQDYKLKYDNDICGQELLKLVSRGSAIIAEILRLKDHIPEFFYNPNEEKKYMYIIFDFSYFKNVDYCEDKIRNTTDLRNLDEEFRENYLEIFERFFKLFYSIYQYITDLETYIEQVKQGVYVQHTIETILMSKDIRHFLCESIFQYGVMLLLMDRLMPGPIREKIIISYYRYKGQSTIANFDVLVAMFKNTEYSISKIEEKKPKKYPVDLFLRHRVDQNIVKLIIGILKDNDIYDQIGAYPSPEHRSHALSNQAAIIFVLLHFIPDYLEIENAKMREIVDKHFADNWVISIYMGYTVDILDYWKDFKAAKNALSITISNDTVKALKINYYTKLKEMNQKLLKFLYEGFINEDYVLDNINLLINIMRESNVVLRWILLQRTTSNKKYKEMINQDLKDSDLINLLLSISHFEYLLKNMFQQLIDNKETMWNDDKSNCMFRLKELSEYFSGLKNFGKQVKQEEFKDFFDKHYKNLDELSFTNSTSAGRKIVLIKESLENIKFYHYVEANLQIKQYINEITQYLNHMLRIVNVKNKVLINIAQISDFSYAWIVIQDYLPIMQEFLKQDSKYILLLRATFLKLASILNFPLVRLFEAESPDITSVTNYYSGELVKFVGNVLQIVPLSVFNHLESITNVFTKGFNELPIKLLKADLKDYTQYDDRYVLAKATSQISLFTKGILMMEKTLMGVIEVDPKVILEDGIRKELLGLLAINFHRLVDFTAGHVVDFNSRLNELTKRISRIKKSFIYIQDYININGSRMWSVEVHRLVNYYVDIEANRFLNKKIKLDKYDLGKFPIPRFTPIQRDTESLTFIGRIVRYIVSATKPKFVTFYPSTFTWYDSYSKEVIGIKTLHLIKQSMGVEGIQGLNRFLGYVNYDNICNIKKSYTKIIFDKNNLKSLKNLASVFKNPTIIEFSEKDTIKSLLSSISSSTKSLSSSLLPYILNIGHIEIIRIMLTNCLKESLEVDSNVMNSQMENLNRLNLHILQNYIDVKFNSQEFAEQRYNKILCDIFEDCGFINPLQNFYLNLASHEHLVLILVMITFNEMVGVFAVDKKSGNIYKKNKNDEFDFYYFIYGIYVILYQMGKNNVTLFISYLVFMIKHHLQNQYTLKDAKGLFDRNTELPMNVMLMQLFLQQLANLFEIENYHFDANTNDYLIFKTLSNS